MTNLKEFVLFGDAVNRVISPSILKNVYNSIEINGYLPDVSKVEYLMGESIKESKLVSFEVVAKDDKKPLTINNFKIMTNPVEWNKDSKAVIDGQHRLAAMMLFEALDKEAFDGDSICTEVHLPKSLTISEFIAMKNTSKPWTAYDFEGTQIVSGNSFIDKISEISKNEGLTPQVAYDLYSLNTGSLKVSIVKALRAKTQRLPTSIKLDDSSISDGNQVLQALKDSSFLTKELYNNTRFSKGIKQFIKASKISTSDLCELIGKIDKTIWEKYFTTSAGVSAEAQLYKNGFTELNKFLLG